MQTASKTVNYTDEQVKLANFAKAMSHPTRICILQKLAKTNACVYSGEIVKELNINKSALSLHLKELKLSGLINGTAEPPFIKYCINKENWNTAKKLFANLLSE